jgi:hypothetical protein
VQALPAKATTTAPNRNNERAEEIILKTLGVREAVMLSVLTATARRMPSLRARLF